MKENESFLLELWRAVCLPTDLQASVSAAAPLLARRFPLDLILVRTVDLERECLETLAAEKVGPTPVPSQVRTPFLLQDLNRLAVWGRKNTVQGSLPWSEGLCPAGDSENILAGPLQPARGALGVLVLLLAKESHWGEPEAALAQEILAPFTVALQNDRHIHELTALRESAEADRRSLLSRLDRHDITDSIVGAETGLRPVMEQVQRVAGSDVPVLILGETGSGKEVVARAIHGKSRRSTGPFIRVNCGAISPELIDSELFGHERGSFTGAVNQRLGWFERADGGTLFLDECGELPPAVQVRLLRILQDGSFERVGGQKPLHVNLRIVAATHRNLRSMVRDGRFREDLWYRLAVFPIHLPPLRDRLEDIGPLAGHFAVRAARRLGAPPMVPTTNDLVLLQAYHWPGNVRELAAVIERAAILGDGKRLEIAQSLGTGSGGPTLIQQEKHQSPLARSGESSEPFLTLDATAVRHIEAALVRTHGRIEGPAGAAALLGINPHTLRARMRKLGIGWKRFRSSQECA
jgi:hydrogenase-4 transcriptional activator